MITHQELNQAALLGQPVNYQVNGLTFECVVRDVREVWGKPQVQIEPVSGSGLKWVDLSSVKLPAAGMEVAR
ncbi:MAG TPA: hypothetical protein VEH27_00665 [Methylomirabilota bacterium]|nr:hypothetical protein [Methylomirabilota bacterium]